MAKNVVQVNRAPVMTLWAAVVAERLGFDRDLTRPARRWRIWPERTSRRT